MTHNLTKMLLGGGLLLTLGACDGGDTANGICELDVEGDPDCLLDGACNVDDPNDPDCDFCDYPENVDDPDCQVDPCDEPNPPPECDPFVPGAPQTGGGVSMSGFVAYDPDNNNARGWNVPTTMGDVESPPYFTVLVSDDRYDTTNNPAYRCRVVAAAAEGATLPIEAVSREIRTQAALSGGEDTREYNWYETTFATGSFTVEDAPQDTQAGRIEGCSTKYVDPAVWPNGINGTISSADWSFAWGDMAPIIEELVTQTNNNDPNTDYDLFDLFGNGFVAGGGMGKPSAATPPYTAYYVSYAFALGEDWKTIETGNEDDPDQRLPVSEMTPAEGNPARGIYFLSSYNSWSARFIFLDQSG